jgi:hypothetical protein
MKLHQCQVAADTGSVANWYTHRRPHFRLAFACVVGEPACDQTQNRIRDPRGQRYSSTRSIRTRPSLSLGRGVALATQTRFAAL